MTKKKNRRFALDVHGLNSFTAEGQRFRPGIHIVTNVGIKEAADRARFGVSCRELEEGEDIEEAAYEGAPPLSGELSAEERKSGTKTESYPCDLCELAFESIVDLDAHHDGMHPLGGESTEATEAEAAEAEATEATEDSEPVDEAESEGDGDAEASAEAEPVDSEEEAAP